MRPAALRFVLCGGGLLTAFALVAAEDVLRVSPTRPGSTPSRTPEPAVAPVPGKRLGGVEYVSVADVARHLGLKSVSLERGRKVQLTGAATRAELERDTRDISINGLRVFLGEPALDSGGQLHVSR